MSTVTIAVDLARHAHRPHQHHVRPAARVRRRRTAWLEALHERAAAAPPRLQGSRASARATCGAGPLGDEVRDLEQRIDTLETELEAVARKEPVVKALCAIPGIGTLTATALFAIVGNVHASRTGRRSRAGWA